MTRQQLIDWVMNARQRTCDLVADLADDQLLGPRLAIVNPLLWELGHLAWFQEKWVLRHACRRGPIRADADSLYDSTAIAHDIRWDLPLPGRDETLGYLLEVRDRVIERVQQGPTPEEEYFIKLSVFHEDMHAEAFTYTRQTLGYRRPQLREGTVQAQGGASPGQSNIVCTGDVQIPGGVFRLGACPDEPFVFDNEKWAHSVEVKPFAIARTPVTQAEFAVFVESGGYGQRQHWSEAGWRWHEQVGATHPAYWQREPSGSWLRRDFDRWLALEPNRPMVHVAWYEAEAYCRWAGRRLPTELEWEVAAAARPGQGCGLAEDKKHYPWGEEVPTPRHANLDGLALGCVSVGELPDGDSAFGCRQLLGNVWEWTASDFQPYPGFVPDPYREYSAPWFGSHKVLRGGCWATRARLLRNTWRNFYLPERRDIYAGFRTCHV